MGLTGASTGACVLNRCGLHIEKETQQDKIVALAGNPNVGKSTVFNSLTGLNQHTGNWPGKTVANAQGKTRHKGTNFILVDIPGTYSLMANSVEEEVARDFICFGEPDAVVVVADATCLERNLNLVLQTMEITDKTVLCVNLMDEAEKKRIRIDLDRLSTRLGIPVVGTSARAGLGLEALMDAVASLADGSPKPLRVVYDDEIEEAVSLVEPAVESALGKRISSRWVCLKLLEGDESLLRSLKDYLGCDLMQNGEVAQKVSEARRALDSSGISRSRFRDTVVTKIVQTCEKIGRETVTFEKKEYAERDRKLDKILTSKLTGIPIMIALLFFVFWLTLAGANVPSKLIANGLFALEDRLSAWFASVSALSWLSGPLIDGMYRTLAWVVSVMLPPMAIFFPLFTLLEDSGYLPRIAFNLDNFFRRACAHGKQSLTMCMGFGCNAAGVTGCRIIASPRERLIAVLTNSFVPCNGRFPLLIAVIGMFFAGSGALSGILSALLLTAFVLLGTAATLAVSGFLSKTLLRGVPSSLTLELPPFRRPQIGRVLVRSVLDRTLFVLGRAATAAAPAGLVLWLAANLRAGGGTLLSAVTAFLDPAGRFLGMDGVILTAFVLGIPANEIVLPIVIMAYASESAITGFSDVAALRTLLVQHGWTRLTALCVMLFSLFHWPCATTLLTVKKETGSAWLTLLSLALPTALGAALCAAAAAAARLLGLA